MDVLSQEQLAELVARTTGPVLRIIVGASGSGKSTLASTLAPAENIFTTDDVTLDGLGGLYNEDGSFNGMKKPDGGLPMIVLAHIQNAKDVEAAMQAGLDPVIVPNTNTRRCHFESYLVSAYNNGYQLVYDNRLASTDLTADQLASRCVHGVPVGAIQGQMDELAAYPDWMNDSPTFE